MYFQYLYLILYTSSKAENNDKFNPIFKSGKEELLMNYTPISALQSYSKIIEKIVYNRSHTHLKNNVVLDLYILQKKP